MNNALLEIGTEHLPARFLLPTLEQLKNNAAAILREHRLKYVSLRTFGTYRKLVLEITDLASVAEDIQKEVKGPPAKLLKDESGNYTPQAAGFAAKNGLKPSQLVTVETDKGPFIFAKVKIKGEKTQKLLPAVFTEIIKSLNFPKNMVWEESGFHFARPIRSLLALYGDKVVKFELAGVKSGRNTYPLISFGRKPIRINTPQDYTETLKNQPQPILADIEERRHALIKTVEACAAALGYKADLDESLITETLSFTEHPVALSGDMDIRFLTLPRELITTVLKTQLRMFPVVNEDGELQPHFIAVRDGVSDNQNEVRTGFKNVMTARFTDAVFFYENDLKTGLDAMRNKLAGVNFIDGMGNMLEKSERVEKLACKIADKLNLKQEEKAAIKEAAHYAYADLTGGVVYEFSELQGYMGGVYAEKTGKNKHSAKAMGEFYYPLTASSALPFTIEGSVVSLAGKMDSLAANFAMGQIPSGSEDPYALRRQAMGAVRIISENNFDISIKEIVAMADELLPRANEHAAELEDFLWQRLANILEAQGSTQDEIAALRNTDKSPTSLLAAAEALKQYRNSESLASVGQSAKRVGNILKKGQLAQTGEIDASIFECEEEKNLFKALTEIEAQIAPKLGLDTTEGYCAILKALAAFELPLNSFFDKVMVNAEDEKIRHNRINMLGRINGILTGTVADISKLQKRG